MPTRYQVALGLLYTITFVSIAFLKLGLTIMHWAMAKFGLYPMLGGLAVYAMIPLGSILLVNKINRDWPTLSLPPQPVYAPEIVQEDEMVATHQQIEAGTAAAKSRISVMGDMSAGGQERQ